MKYNKLKTSRKLLPLLLAALFLAQCEEIFDIEPPEISFILPTDTGRYFGTVPVELKVSDNFGISKVELFSEGESIMEFTERPFKTDLSVADFSGTEASLRAVAFDNVGNWSEAKQILQMTIGIRVTAPNGGEMWDQLTSQTIEWESSGNIGSSVSIEISLDGGTSWITLYGSTPNDGNQIWAIPQFSSSDQPNSRIRVSSISGAYADMSNNNFTILSVGPAVTNEYPADGATVSAGASGQLLSVISADATSGVFWYDDDTQISWSASATKNGDSLKVTVPYVDGVMNSPGTNYWYVEATNSGGTTRYPATGYFTFTVLPAPPSVSNPDPADGATVSAGASVQLLRVTAPDATGGIIWYDDDSLVDFSATATLNGDFLEATIPYVQFQMNNNGTNYWFVEATNSGGTTRYPATGNLSFTVVSGSGPPTVSLPDPADGVTAIPGGAGHLLRVTALGATSGVIWYDDDNTFIDWNTSATVNGDFLEAVIPYVSGKLDRTGALTNYWYVEATNSDGTTRYPASGLLSFTVQEIFNSTDVPISIADNSTVTSAIFVGASGTVNDVNIGLDIEHTFTGDLTIILQSPIGTQVVLVANRGGGGSDFTNTFFDDEASTSITSGGPPFTGAFQPENFLSAFDGENVNGTWILGIIDGAGGDTGTLNSWFLDF